MIELVKFSCGCIGTKPRAGRSHVVRLCDSYHVRDESDEDDITFSSRDVADKTFEPIDPFGPGEARYGKLMLELSSLIRDGHRLRKLKRLLRD